MEKNMEHEMETTIYWFYWDNGKENGSYYLMSRIVCRWLWGGFTKVSLTLSDLPMGSRRRAVGIEIMRLKLSPKPHTLRPEP